MSPRPTPQHSKPRPRREEILDQATQLFAERGYEGTSMADLAERVALRKASLFHHFGEQGGPLRGGPRTLAHPLDS